MPSLASFFLRRKRNQWVFSLDDGNSGTIELGDKMTGARKSFKKGDPEMSKAYHDMVIAQAKEAHKSQGKYIKSVVYGGLDGIITTFAVVASVAGANLSMGIVIVMGLANLFADGLSMGMGDFLSSKAETQYHKMERKREEWEVENYLEGEKQEMVGLYKEKGLTEDDAKTVVDIISKDPKVFVDIMMVEELGIIPEDEGENPMKNGAVTFLSFLFFGSIPLLAYIVTIASVGTAKSKESGFNVTFVVSIILTALTMFLLGAITSRFTTNPWWKQGLITLCNGAVTACVAFLIGFALEALVENSC